MKKPSLITFAAALCSLLLTTTPAFSQGSPTPPGPPGPTMKTLDQIEPRTPISSLPYSITNSGSYYLTANLTNPSAFFPNGITIEVDNVALDLMGFTLLGATGATNGIVVPSSQTNLHNLSVRNGTIRGWNDGVGLSARNARNGQFQHLNLSDNRVGIEVGDNSTVTECAAFGNRSDGISVVGGGTTVTRCVARENQHDGFNLAGSDGSTMSDCSSTRNGNRGYRMDNHNVLNRCVAVNNGTGGIVLGDKCTLRDCSSTRNGRAGGDHPGDGIVGGSHNSLSGCTATDNDGRGINLGNGCAVVNCIASGNWAFGILVLDGNTIIGSTANNNIEGDGILVAYNCTVKDCTTRQNSYDGIRIYGGTTVSGCTADANGSTGIFVYDSQNRIDSNHAANNGSYGIYVDWKGNVIIRNSAWRNGASPNNSCSSDFYFVNASGNTFGEIICHTDLAGGRLTSSHGPWANLAGDFLIP